MTLRPKEEELLGLKEEILSAICIRGSYYNVSNADILCCCNGRRALLKRKSNDFFHFISTLFFFILIISDEVTLSSASYSRRRPNADWEVDDKESDFFLNDYNDKTKCLEGEYLDGYSLSGGTKAGRYMHIGTVDSMKECANLCCNQEDCNLAIRLLHPKTGTYNCFRVDCYDDYDSNRCKPVISGKSKFEPYIFKRGIITNDASAVDSELTKNKPERNEPMCMKYTGSVCLDSIDPTKYYYSTTSDLEALNDKLGVLIRKLSIHLTTECRKLAQQIICYNFYPWCSDLINPKRMNICKKGCSLVTSGDCVDEFRRTSMLSYLQNLIPGCNSLFILGPDQDETSGSGISDEDCMELTQKGLMAGTKPTGIVYLNDYKDRIQLRSEDSPLDGSGYAGMSLQNTSVSTSPAVPLKSVPHPTSPATVEKNGSLKIDETVKDVVNSSASTNISSTVEKIMPTPAIVDVRTKDSAETNLAEVDTAAPTTKVVTTKAADSANTTATPAKSTQHHSTQPKPSTVPVPVPEPVDEEIRVSLGDNTVVTLPDNQVSLFASTWPKEKKDGEYLYEWMQISAPSKSHGYIEGKNSKNVKLTKLDVAGVYTFKLTVKSKDDKKHGVGFVNITVKEPSRVNHPPRAEISPKEQTIQLPTDTVILDGSKSKDDVGIVSYKWEELKGPIKEKTVFASSTDSKILQLKNLVAGDYKFRLTVADAEGETDKREATVTVKKENDYPPKANAGNDVIIHLPQNSVVLNGNQSTDDKNTLKFQWSKTPESPTCDMQGTDNSQLKLSRLQQGTYVFTLKVTDTSGQSNEAKVKVVVLPEKNVPPVAVAGDDKELIYPDDSTTLDGSKSTDNSKIVSYKWEQISGPSKASLIGANDVKVHLSKLVAGSYVMKLTVTDDKNVIGTDTVKVHVKKGHNENPVAVAGHDLVVFLPTRFAVIDGSKSHDDEVIEHYRWTRAGLSPAAGVVINGSDRESVLRLSNLVKGRYVFDLTVTDNKGLTGVDSVTVLVQEHPRSFGLVELFLYLDIDNFSEENKIQLIRKISVILEVPKEYVIVEEITGYQYGKGVLILFYVKDPNMDRVLDGKYVADMIKQKVGFGGKLFEYTMIRVEPYICRNNCSDHGYCDKSTKTCVCDSFWTANFLKSKFGEQESNCDWSILYLSVAVFILFLIFIAVSWAICFCFARKKRNKRRARYRALRTTDPDGSREEILLIPKGMKERFSGNSMTFTESDDDSDQETTVFDKKILSNGHIRMNGTVNGKISKYKD